MRKKLALFALILFSLVGCTSGTRYTNEYDGIDADYTKIHLFGIGCVDKSKTKVVVVGDDEGLLIKYTDKYGDEFITTEFAFVKGSCPICKK